jgi:cellulose synthase/poly-beta-1,6-N-acetylglucosamine synthase-like glycosyltransferase
VSKVHVVIITHTPRHIRRTLMGVAVQRRAADSITVSIDGDGAEVVQAVRDAAAEFGVAVNLVTRAHQGVCRSAQVRNNGARAAIEGGAGTDDVLVFFDGDCCPAPDALERFELLFAKRGKRPVALVIGHWITLSETQTKAFDERALRNGAWPVMPSDDELAKLPRRQRRYKRQLALRRLGLSKGHKPKLASGNFAIRVGEFVAVNGFDEMYEGYGQEDDDLGRRVYKHGGRAVMGVDQCLVFHQWHPTRQPGAWETAPGVERFKKPYGVEAERGLRNPKEQPMPRVEVVGGVGRCKEEFGGRVTIGS